MDSELRQFRMGAFKSLSLSQFGSTRLDGQSLNTPQHGDSDIGIGPGHDRPLALKSDTYGSANAAMAWRKNGLLSYGTKTRGSTFSFE